MIKSVFIAGGIALVLSGAAFAQSSEKGAAKSPSAATSAPVATERNAAAIAACDKLSGTQKADCLKEARAADPSATGATGGTASGGAGTAAPKAQKDAAPAPGAPKAY